MNELLEKYFSEIVSNEEKADLFRQLEQDPELKKEFVRLQNLIAVSNMMDRKEDEKWMLSKFKQLTYIIKKRKQRYLFNRIIKYNIAAILLVAVSLITKENTLSRLSHDFTCIEVPKGQQVIVKLPDGTDVWLSSRTKLKYSSLFNRKHRTVKLDGEGLFSVYKNTSKPFIVITEDYHIQVTGTEFNVFAYAESNIFETELISGGLSIFNGNNKDQGLALRTNEKAYLQNGILYKTNGGFSNIQDLKSNIFSFESSSLKDIVNRLELWYDIKFNIKNPEAGKDIFSGKFKKTDDIEFVLQAMKETGKFDYTIIKEKDEIKLIEID